MLTQRELSMGYFFWILFLMLKPTESNACNPYYESRTFDLTRHQFIPIADDESTTGITEEQFNQVLDRIDSLYQPIFQARGEQLLIVRDWESSTVNAYARREGTVRKLRMYGGYARHRLADIDAFILLACHEIGHHIGGTPFYRLTGWEWCSAEGEADYFATLKCTRHFMADDENEAIVAMLEVPDAVRSRCMATFNERNDQLICQRGAVAGFKMSQIWEDGRGTFDFSTPDPKIVSATSYTHPAGQCRIDTYLAGSTCVADANHPRSATDARTGACNIATGHTEGVRPRCWYSPE
jgi:hypothetical protein